MEHLIHWLSQPVLVLLKIVLLVLLMKEVILRQGAMLPVVSYCVIVSQWERHETIFYIHVHVHVPLSLDCNDWGDCYWLYLLLAIRLKGWIHILRNALYQTRVTIYNHRRHSCGQILINLCCFWVTILTHKHK